MMRVTCIVAGTGGMHCGACARDVSLVRELARLGCQARLVPLYLPLRIEGAPPPDTAPTFFGGVNVYLQQHVGLFRHTPRAVNRLFDSRPLLGAASKLAGGTNPAKLGPMTVSMLQGEHGRQRKELERLIEFIESGERPDLIALSNSLLSGVVPALRRRVPVPIVCTLQGGDEFAGSLPAPYAEQAHDLLRRNAGQIDAFISPSDHYAARIAEYLGVPRSKITTVPTGIDATQFPLPASRPRRPFVVGYLSRIAPSKGLDLLIEAVATLVNDEARDVRLHVAGQRTDRAFWHAVERQIAAADLGRRVRFVRVGNAAERARFLNECSAFSVPSRTAEVRGTAAMEAMAAGVPVVLPDSGAYHEIVAVSEGGLLFPSGDARLLAAGLAKLDDDPDYADELGLVGHDGVCLHYSAANMAERTCIVYRELLKVRPKNR